MRKLLPLVAALLLLAACGSNDPPASTADARVDAPSLGADVDDAAPPCGGLCGAGTVCADGRCVALDAGPVADASDVGELADVAADVRPDVAADAPRDAGAVDGQADAARDAGADDAPPIEGDPLTFTAPSPVMEVRGSDGFVLHRTVAICTASGADGGAPLPVEFSARFVEFTVSARLARVLADGALTVTSADGATTSTATPVSVRFGAPYTAGGARRINVTVTARAVYFGGVGGPVFTFNVAGCEMR